MALQAGGNKPKKLRGFSRGVTPNRAVRMVTMASPICPNSQPQFEIRDGRRVQKAQDATKPNCQSKAWDKRGYPWWEDCEKAGHDPYYTRRHFTVSEPQYEDQDGEQVLVGMKEVWREEKFLNTVQVAQGLRHNSGRGVRIARELKGRRFLSEMRHEEVCQFRNCQEPVDFHWASKSHGGYCGKEHFSLAAANERGEMLHLENTGLAPEQGTRIHQQRQEQLERVAAFIERN